MVATLDIPYLRFFAVSVAVHLTMFLIVYPARPVRVGKQEKISVSLLETPAKIQPETAKKIEAAPTPIPAPVRRARKPATIAKKDPPPAHAKTQAAPAERGEEKPLARAESAPAAAPKPPPEPPAIVPEESVVAERPLPTVKELLPPLTWSADSRSDNAPISLNTRDPLYVSYFTKIKQLIESHWQYPELALRYGLQGRLFLEFTVGADGRLERLRMVRSSGSQLLDEEALRAIKAAAPFPPIPRWIQPNPLPISAAMEYHDNRVNYQFAR
jgi:protein TonB